MEQSKNMLWVVVVVALMVGFFAGWVYGKRTTTQTLGAKIKNLEKSLNTIFPEPPEEVKTINGTIQSIDTTGGNFVLEIRSFTDRYPIPGQAPRMETRTVRVTDATKIEDLDVNPKSFGSLGSQRTPRAFSDLKPGYSVMVTTEENIRTSETLTALSIERVVLPFAAPPQIQR